MAWTEGGQSGAAGKISGFVINFFFFLAQLYLRSRMLNSPLPSPDSTVSLPLLGQTQAALREERCMQPGLPAPGCSVRLHYSPLSSLVPLSKRGTDCPDSVLPGVSSSPLHHPAHAQPFAGCCSQRPKIHPDGILVKSSRCKNAAIIYWNALPQHLPPQRIIQHQLCLPHSCRQPLGRQRNHIGYRVGNTRTAATESSTGNKNLTTNRTVSQNVSLPA